MHPTQIAEWKKLVLDNLTPLFSDKRTREGKTDQQKIDELYRIIGKRETEIEWLKKICASLTRESDWKFSRAIITVSPSRAGQSSSVFRGRACTMNQSIPTATNQSWTRSISCMRAIHSTTSRRCVLFTRGEYGITAGIDLVRRLTHLMGLEAIYPKPNLSKSNLSSYIYLYLLKNIVIIRPNQV